MELNLDFFKDLEVETTPELRNKLMKNIITSIYSYEIFYNREIFDAFINDAADRIFDKFAEEKKMKISEIIELREEFVDLWNSQVKIK